MRRPAPRAARIHRSVDAPTACGALLCPSPGKEGTSTQDGSTVDKWLVLADKTAVGYPEDFAPVVGEDSDTMRAARASADMRSRKVIAGTIATVGILGGLVLGGVIAHSLSSVPRRGPGCP